MNNDGRKDGLEIKGVMISYDIDRKLVHQSPSWSFLALLVLTISLEEGEHSIRNRGMWLQSHSSMMLSTHNFRRNFREQESLRKICISESQEWLVLVFRFAFLSLLVDDSRWKRYPQWACCSEITPKNVSPFLQETLHLYQRLCSFFL